MAEERRLTGSAAKNAYQEKIMEENAISKVEEIERSDPKDAETQFELAQHYFKGSGTKKDYSKALEWYEKAAAQGHAGAQFKMGQCCYKGLGTEQDLNKALEWYETAGKNGHSLAACTAGDMYYNGDGVEKDLYKAKEWYEQTREHAGKSKLYDINKELDTKLSTKEIREYEKQLESNAENGNVGAMLALADWYSNGKNVRPSMETARFWANQALAEGSKSAPHQIGVILERSGDPRNAVKWFKNGADLGDSNAMYKYATYLLEGEYVNKDQKAACELLSSLYSRGQRGLIYDRYKISRLYSETKKAIEEQEEPVHEPVPEKKKTTVYREPVWGEVLGIIAAVLVVVLSVCFVKIGGGRYGNEAEIVLKGFKKTLAELVCVGGIIGLSIAALELPLLFSFDIPIIGGFVGGVGGIAAVILLGAYPVTLTVVKYAAAAVIALLIIRILIARKVFHR